MRRASPHGRRQRYSRRRVLLGGAAFVGLPFAACAQTMVLAAERFGILADGDPARNAAGLRAALEALRDAGGGELRFGVGRYGFALESTMALPPGTRICGAGKSRTFLERTDQRGANWFTSHNSTGGLDFEGFTATGNGQSFVNGDGAFLFATLGEDARASMDHVVFRDIELRNFKGDGWIFFLLGNTAHDIRQIHVDATCSFVSSPGNSRGPADIGIWSSALIFQGNLHPDARGRIRHVVVGAVEADIPHIKSLCVLWGGVEHARIERPLIRRCGTIDIAPGCGAYALMVGNETEGAPNPTEVDIVGPRIHACQSAGLYFASWGSSGGTVRFDGAGGFISNVTDRMNGSLPKGAIACTDSATDLSFRNLRTSNCIAALDIAVGAGARILIDGVHAEGINRGGAGIWIREHKSMRNPDAETSVTLRNVRVQSRAADVTGIRITGSPVRTQIRLEGQMEIDVPYIGIGSFDENGSGRVRPFAGLDWRGRAVISNAGAGAIVLRNNVSPIRIAADISIERGDRAGARDTRVKVGGVADLTVSGTINVRDVRANDAPAWDSNYGARPSRISIRPGAVSF